MKYGATVWDAYPMRAVGNGFSEFDPTNYLSTREDIEAFLAAAAEECVDAEEMGYFKSIAKRAFDKIA